MLLRLVVFLILLFLIGPVVIIVLFSFHESQSLSFPFTGFSLRWYSELLSNDQLLGAIWFSFKVALLTSIITMVIGTAASLAWLRLERRGRTILELACIIPIALPALFLGVSLLVGFSQARIQLSIWTIVIAHTLLTVPMVMVAMRARLALFDPALEEAARDLGASTIGTFRRVTIPLMAPTLVATGILAFALSFDEFIVTSFVSGTETTLPMFIWSMMRRTVTPVINAVSGLALAITVGLLVVAWLIAVRRRSTANALANTDLD
ncbi:MAG: ABC transporter permease [Rhizobiaceae bacterium]